MSEVPDFVHGVPDELQCGICHDVVDVPFVTEVCGHLYCHDCILAALDRKKECPLCRKPLTRDGIRKDVRVQRQVQSLPVKCRNAEHGCEETCALSDLDGHMERCAYSEATCPLSVYGCDAVVCGNALPAHLSECPVTLRLSQGDAALKRELAIRQRPGGQFIWPIKDFQSRREVSSSPDFTAHGFKWRLRHEPQRAALFVVPVDHNKRAYFTLTLFNADQQRDFVRFDDTWPVGMPVKGFGFEQFITAKRLQDPGFVVNGCVTVGVVIHGLKGG
eukprot:CAMPEP_0174832042 /NCGR_PEP_ID=MMETSP1114-20130205/3454_1 /TAXON_ID=312471 /ORGANISM="Neobodo designis, Strain CCAP 1951/1" /LENGTH=274 /DNA_ID=CAMNT_0016065893 /DNA_START=66 /DNA_END=890 /DNA_ORIENTATION=-